MASKIKKYGGVGGEILFCAEKGGQRIELIPRGSPGLMWDLSLARILDDNENNPYSCAHAYAD